MNLEDYINQETLRIHDLLENNEYVIVEREDDGSFTDYSTGKSYDKNLNYIKFDGCYYIKI